MRPKARLRVLETITTGRHILEGSVSHHVQEKSVKNFFSEAGWGRDVLNATRTVVVDDDEDIRPGRFTKHGVPFNRGLIITREICAKTPLETFSPKFLPGNF